MYSVLLGDVAAAYNYYIYFTRFCDLLDSNKEKYTPKTFFVQDMLKGCKNSFSGCLMRLYDKRKDTLTIINFLKELQKQPEIFFKADPTHYKSLIKADLSSLSLSTNNKMVEILNKLRNKKYFHNSIEYAKFHTVIDPSTQMAYELKSEEIRYLIDITISITRNYQVLFGKNIDNFLIRIDSMEDIFLLLGHHCFSTKPTVY
jgi:hypothetical protein